MKIAIMMRAMDQDSGHQAITMGLVEGLLNIDKQNSYLLLYRTDKFLGRFAAHDNVKEKLLKASHKLLWDQRAVPYYSWKEKADIIFNPKFSVPLIAHCPVVMGLHEPAWWAWPEHYERFDRVYMKLALPLYIKKSKHLFPISQFVVDECRKYIDAPFTNVMIAYPAPKEYFKKIEDTKILGAIREEYNLPEHFVFSTTRVDHPGLDNSTSFFPGKNPETTARAFIRCKKEIAIPHKLVIAGRRVRDYFLHLGFSKEEFSDIHFLDFVPHQDLPAILNLSDLFVLSSYYESYAMALVEAIACGCPVIAANTGACPEITSGAGILANPHDFKDFASKIKQVLIDSKLNNELRRKSIERAAFFNWTRTAKEILNKMEKVHESATKGRST